MTNLSKNLIWQANGDKFWNCDTAEFGIILWPWICEGALWWGWQIFIGVTEMGWAKGKKEIKRHHCGFRVAQGSAGPISVIGRREIPILPQ